MCLAVPGRILSIDGEDPLMRSGCVDFGAVRREVSLAFLAEARPGDYVLVHAGVGISLLDEGEARAVFEALDDALEGL